MIEALSPLMVCMSITLAVLTFVCNPAAGSRLSAAVAALTGLVIGLSIAWSLIYASTEALGYTFAIVVAVVNFTLWNLHSECGPETLPDSGATSAQGPARTYLSERHDEAEQPAHGPQDHLHHGRNA